MGYVMVSSTGFIAESACQETFKAFEGTEANFSTSISELNASLLPDFAYFLQIPLISHPVNFIVSSDAQKKNLNRIA